MDSRNRHTQIRGLSTFPKLYMPQIASQVSVTGRRPLQLTGRLSTTIQFYIQITFWLFIPSLISLFLYGIIFSAFGVQCSYVDIQVNLLFPSKVFLLRLHFWSCFCSIWSWRMVLVSFQHPGVPLCIPDLLQMKHGLLLLSILSQCEDPAIVKF